MKIHLLFSKLAMVRLLLLLTFLIPELLAGQVRNSVTSYVQADSLQKNEKMLERLLDEVSVSGRKSGNISYSSRKLLDRIPAILGEKDILKYMATMPGVATTSVLDPGIYVRGGNSIENAFLVNDMEIANPNHLTGILSTFDPFILNRSAIYKSGFPARYNNYLSSYINMFSESGSKENASGEFSVGLLSSVLRTQMPCGRNGKTSMALSARASYLQHMAELYNKAASGAMPAYSFYDITGSIHTHFSEKWSLTAFGLFTIDKLKMHLGTNIPDDMKWNTGSANLNLRYTGNNAELSWKTGFYQGGVMGNMDTRVSMTGKNRNENFATSLEYRRRMGERLDLLAGIKYERAFFRFNNLQTSNESRKEYNIGKTYLEFKYGLSEKLHLDGGINFQYYSGEVQAADCSPRLKLSWNSGRWNVWADYAKTVQYLSRYSLFTLKSPIDIWVPLGKGTAPAVCHQYSCGASCDIYPGLYLYAALFLKNMDKVKDFSMGLKNDLDILASLLLEGTGQAKGFEWDIIYNSPKFYLRANYTLSDSWRKFKAINGGNKFRPPYDIRHNILLNVSYKLGQGWKLNALWTYTSGTYATFPVGVAIARNVNDETGEPVFVPVYRDRYNFKLPDNHRLDVGVDYRKEYYKWTMVLDMGVYNVYNQQNAAFVYFVPQQKDRYYTRFVPRSRVLLPCIPYVSVTLIW